MAKLRIEVASLSTEQTVDDATAALVLGNYALATGASAAWTDQQRLDHVREQLSAYMVAVARDYFVRLAMEEAREEAEASFGF